VVVRSRVASSHWPVELGIGVPIGEVLGHVDVRPALTTDPRVIVTNRSRGFAQWRYGAEFLGYRVVNVADGAVVVRARSRGGAQELVLLDALGLDQRVADRGVGEIIEQSGSTHALRLGTARLRCGFVDYPGGGPVLAWRSVSAEAMPPLANWKLAMGDVELF
jgi:hypothetical protein